MISDAELNKLRDNASKAAYTSSTLMVEVCDALLAARADLTHKRECIADMSATCGRQQGVCQQRDFLTARNAELTRLLGRWVDKGLSAACADLIEQTERLLNLTQETRG